MVDIFQIIQISQSSKNRTLVDESTRKRNLFPVNISLDLSFSTEVEQFYSPGHLTFSEDIFDCHNKVDVFLASTE